MTNAEFAARYELGTHLGTGGVDSWEAVARESGEAVMVHRISGPQRIGVLHMVHQLDPTCFARILEQCVVDDVPVVVTVSIPRFSTFMEWLQANVPATSTAVLRRLRPEPTATEAMSSDAPPIGEPVVELSGNSLTGLTALFAASAKDSQSGPVVIGELSSMAAPYARMGDQPSGATSLPEEGPSLRSEATASKRTPPPAAAVAGDHLAPPELREVFLIEPEHGGEPVGQSPIPRPAPPSLYSAPSEFTQVIQPLQAPGLSASAALIESVAPVRPRSILLVLIPGVALVVAVVGVLLFLWIKSQSRVQ